MLQLKNIVKDYPAGDGAVHALRGIDLNFRKSEFVSILGPSGCGKTTMLNIIGGLDKYTEGDLVINGRSTKEFGDRDWDSYRNHSVGFVFQSYNLIPHQSVLQNVELALSLSGVSKAERRKRAKEALCQVGLEEQINKKPSEMSGGQMQRVAIARAIVNNPDIILADEPTGALDTETSVQVMDILKDFSKDRLVIMVPHNPDLAEKYSTRIVRMLDGVITEDSMPLTLEEISSQEAAGETENGGKVRKPSMSIFTSFSLSLKNLFSKKGRTMLTSFAGSIGIIGIALIYAVSQGTTAYIDAVQEDTLASYPLTIEEQHTDINSLFTAFLGQAESSGEHEKDAVYQKALMYELVNALNQTETNENDLNAFKTFIEKEMKDKESKLSSALTGVQYTYNTDMLVYTENVDGTIIESDTSKLLQELLIEYMGMDLSPMMSMSAQSPASPMMSGGAVLWQEMLSGDGGNTVNEVLKKQYDVIYGKWPSRYNEIILVVDENNEIDDMTLYALGLKSKEDMDALAEAAVNKTNIEIEETKWTYEEICDMDFKVVFPSDCYTLDETTDTFVDLRNTQAGMKYLYDNGVSLKVTGIIRPKEEAVSTMLTGTIGYTHLLTRHIIENSKDSPAVNAQLENIHTDIFTGLPFKENTGNLTDDEKASEFKKYIKELKGKSKAEAYIKMMSIPSNKETEAAVGGMLKGMKRADMESALSSALSTQMSMSEAEIKKYLKSLTDEDLKEIFTQICTENYKMQYAEGVKAQLSALPEEQLIMGLDATLPTLSKERLVELYDGVLEFSDSTYEGNLQKLGYVDLNTPATVNLYAATFEDKDVIEEVIAEYNEGKEEMEKITYTDYVGLMMSSVTTIINAITYVLIAFVAVSLIVSSIMIGVITLISVQERTKEIGILRAIGASKKNVSSMFNAETVMIGFAAGLTGVLVTYLLCIPINAILNYFTGIANLKAVLPLPVALILIGISVILTLFAGIIPSRSAAKKDPVVALRSE
ncbi:MAG: ABC transporter ATP-binding protein/permease [Clostridia bacterium]|nr:ABC transporter ATP-binding protein/permease [Clostridia bacterium]